MRLFPARIPCRKTEKGQTGGHMKRVHLIVVWGLAVFALIPVRAFGGPQPVAPVLNPCTPRFAAGSVVHNPPALYSSHGVLSVRFSYQQTTDAAGRLLHCFMTDTGIQ